MAKKLETKNVETVDSKVTESKTEVKKETVKKAAKTVKAEKKTEKIVEKAAETVASSPVSETEKAAAAEIKETAKNTAKAEKKTAKKSKKAEEIKPVESAVEETKTTEVKAEKKKTTKKASKPATEKTAKKAKKTEESAPVEETPVSPRRSIAFIGSECHPFAKTGGLGDVMYALPRTLVNLNCDVRVIMPLYECIPEKYKEKMVYRGEFYMDLGKTGREYYVGIMEYEADGVIYDFIDNKEFFSGNKPYTNLVDDIPKYCFFSKAALAALNYMNWIPDILHCHDWQAGLVPLYLRTLFDNTPVARAKTIITIHNLRFQGIYTIDHIKYWSGLPDYLFNKDVMTQNWVDANMFKGGLTYSNMITTVSGTYAWEIQSPEYGEGLDAHIRYHSGKLRGIVNGIDYEMWNPATDKALSVNYDVTNVIAKKKEAKKALQAELGLEENGDKIVIGLISRLTDQKGLDLVNSIIPQVMDGNTQFVVLGTGDACYEDSFRYYENEYRGNFAACIQYDEARAHRIYAGADAFLVPSRFEPCGLTQLNSMHYGTVPIVRETGGLKDTVEPFNTYENSGNGFTFDRYDAGLLLDAINRAKTLYFTERDRFDEMVVRDMNKDVSWENSAKQYKDLYLELTQW